MDVVKKVAIVACMIGLSVTASAQDARDDLLPVEGEVVTDAEGRPLDRAEEDAALTEREIERQRRAPEEELVIESSVEYETSEMSLPSADDLLSGRASEETGEEEPRAPRAVQRRRAVQRPAETPARASRGAGVGQSPTAANEATAGDVDERAPRVRDETMGEEATLDERDATTRDVDDARGVSAATRTTPTAVAGDEDQRVWDRPIAADVDMAANPEMGHPIPDAALGGIGENEAAALADRRLEHLGAFRSRIDTSIRELESSATFGVDDPIVTRRLGEVRDNLLAMRTEVENLRKIEASRGNGSPADLEELNNRLILAEERLVEMQSASTSDELLVASQRFEEMIASVERHRSRLDRSVW